MNIVSHLSVVLSDVAFPSSPQFSAALQQSQYRPESVQENDIKSEHRELIISTLFLWWPWPTTTHKNLWHMNFNIYTIWFDIISH